jgi:hypothetical protein
MLTSRRDYLLRLIDEAARLLSRLVSQREKGRPEEAQQALADAFARLFGREFHEVFQFTPDQHYLMLAEDATDETARDRRLLYAALNAEAAQLYDQLGRIELARASRLNALRFTLRALRDGPDAALPAYAPDPAGLAAGLGQAGLDPETAEWVRIAGLPDRGPRGAAPGPAQG